MSAMDRSVDVAVLRDGDGQYFLLPRTLLERARVPETQWEALEEALDSDVSGFGFSIGGLTLVGQVQAQPVGGALEIVSPRDAASGQATGKRQHKPIILTAHYD